MSVRNITVGPLPFRSTPTTPVLLTPVVTSNLSSMPEVTGDAAVLVDPYEVDSIVEGMERVLSNPALSEELRAKGIARAREFSWERSVARTRELYQEVAGVA